MASSAAAVAAQAAGAEAPTTEVPTQPADTHAATSEAPAPAGAETHAQAEKAQETGGHTGEGTTGGNVQEKGQTGTNEGQVGTNTEGTHGSTEGPGHTAETAQPDNPILPTSPELAWAAGTFLILWALMKFVLLKPIVRTMQERSERIRGDVEAAESTKNQAVAALSDYEASLASARVEASRIIDDARAQADEQRKQIIAAAEAEVGQLRAAANAEVAQAKAAALESMRTSVATIAVQAAEAVVQKRLDAAAQRAIVDEYLNRASQN